MIGQHPQLAGLPELKLFAYRTIAELEASLPSYWIERGFTHRSPGLVRALAQIAFGGESAENLAAARAWLVPARALVGRRCVRCPHGAAHTAHCGGEIARERHHRRRAAAACSRLSESPLPASHATPGDHPSLARRASVADHAGACADRRTDGRHRRLVRHPRTHPALCRDLAAWPRHAHAGRGCPQRRAGAAAGDRAVAAIAHRRRGDRGDVPPGSVAVCAFRAVR